MDLQAVKNWWNKSSIWDLFKILFTLMIMLNFSMFALTKIRAFWQISSPQNLCVQIIKIGDTSSGVDAMLPSSKTGIIDNADFYVEQLETAAKNTNAKAILLKINCPGGIPAPCEVVARAVQRVSATKPVFAYVENLCASGAYWIASQCNKIIAPQTATVGSIGVMMPRWNFKEFANWLHIKPSTLAVGKYKTIGDPFGDPEQHWETEYMRSKLLEIYKIFVKSVAQGRKLDEKKAAVWADGQIFTGSKAQELSLIDVVGDQKDAENLIKQHFNHTGEIYWLEPQQPGNILQRFFGAKLQSCCNTIANAFVKGVFQAMCNSQQNTPATLL